MSINNIGGMNPDNINQPNRRRTDNNGSQNSSAETQQTANANGAYGQYLVNHNYNITSSKVNNDDTSMQEVYELDNEIYGEMSSYDSFDDFKNFISSNHLSTYALKDGNGNIVGYYNLEPVNNGDLYIDSMGLKPEYRNTRKGDSAIQTAWNKILEFARDNNVNSLSLHVDADDTEQVDLFEQLGFQTAENLPNYWGTGKNAYFMTYSLDNTQTDIQENKDGIVFAKANDNEEEMKAIYDIDSVAFAEQDPFESFEEYKNYLTEKNVSIYSVKNDDNEMLGYYALEPAVNGNLYIYSIALKPEYRNSRKGYKAIQDSWQKILNDAKNQGVEKLSLHVDADNPRLKKMYEHFGFIPVHTERGYYNNGHDGLYMECPVREDVTIETGEPVVNAEDFSFSAEEEGQTISDNNSAESETAPEPEKPEPTRAQILKQEYKQKSEEVKDDLTNIGIQDRQMQRLIIEKCSYEDKETGKQIFSDKLYNTAKDVYEIVKDEDEWHQRDSFQKIMNSLTYTDKNGVRDIQSEIMPLVQKMKRANIRLYDFDDILNASKIHNQNGEYRINEDVLDKAISVKYWNEIPDYNIDDVIKKCKTKDQDGTVRFNESAYNKYYMLIQNGEHDYSVEHIIDACYEYDSDGKQFFNSDFYRDLSRHLKDSSYDDPTGFKYNFQIKDIDIGGCSAKDYLEFAANIRQNEVIKNALKKYDSKEDVGIRDDRSHEFNIINTAAIIRAVTYDFGTKNYRDYSSDISYKQIEKNIDRTALETLKETLQKEPMPFDNLKNLADVINACKERPDKYSHYKFNPQIFEKAIELKKTGLNDQDVAKVIDACKLKDSSTCYFDDDKPAIKFSNDAFNTIMEHQNSTQYNKSFNAKKIRASIEMYDEKEQFNKDVFDVVKNNYWEDEGYNGGTESFFCTFNNGKNRCFDLDTYKEFIEKARCDIGTISDEDYDRKNHEIQSVRPTKEMINAYADLKSRDIKFEFTGGQKEDPAYHLMWACKNEYGFRINRFSTQAYKHVCELLDEGYNGNQIQNLIYACKPSIRNPETGEDERIFSEERYQYAIKMIKENGVDIDNAASWVNQDTGTTVKDGVMTNDNENRLLELYNMGVKNTQRAHNYCYETIDGENTFNPLAYERLKEAISRGFTADIIGNCKNDGIFEDRLFRYATDMQDRGYDTHTINLLMELSHDTVFDNNLGKDKIIFNQNIFNHIQDMEKLDINKEKMPDILKACKHNYHRLFEEKAFDKVSQLKHKGYDDAGIAKFIEVIVQDRKWSDENKNDEKYERLLQETKRHKDLQATGQDDAYVINEINKNISSFPNVRAHFGDDVLNYAVSFKTDNYVNFANHVNNLIKNSSEPFLTDLKSRLNELPSPELKAKRLRVLGGLAGKVDENAMNVLVRMIKSPKMSEEQVALANKIFTPEGINEADYPEDTPKAKIEEDKLKDYEKRVNQFIEELNTPEQFRQLMYDYLMKERLDKSIERPKSIDEQKVQMEKNAQQVLMNPKIPLDKKITYIDEYKVKIKDMDANPDKYLKPYIYQKPMANLAKKIEAYVNIPNDDIKFNNSITAAMYTHFGIESSPDLLSNIHYDSRYFDKLFSAQQGFKNNFKRLIELRKMSLDMPLTQARLTLPEENSDKYEKYERIGLIDQIKANQDTVRQFNEHNLNFEEWDRFDPEFNGETFSVEADPETEYKNLRYNLINIFQDEWWNYISEKERNKFLENIELNGFTIFNNEIYKGGKKAENPDLERFLEQAVKYIDANKYWQVESIPVIPIDDVDQNNGDPLGRKGVEMMGISAFTDHLKGFQNRYKEIKNARTVNDIHFRLTDDNNIGRNIFFGNHVGCCNSVESSHAGYSAPMHLLNNYNRGIELVDNWGNSYGNSLCYFADVDDKLTFVIDSFEANGKLGSNPIVTDKLIDYASEVCKRMGREDAQIMVGPSYNNMNLSRFSKTPEHKIKVVGTVSERTYCDSVGGRVKDEINQTVANRFMHELKNDKDDELAEPIIVS